MLKKRDYWFVRTDFFCVQLLETKSTDRSQTLLHYIANMVRDKYPAVSPFYNELHYVDKAAAGESWSINNVGLLLITDQSLEERSTDSVDTWSPVVVTWSLDLILFLKKIIKNSIKLIWESSLDRRWTEKCSHLYAVSLENVLCDVKELQRGMELTWREFSVQHNSTLKDFISRNESRLNKLQEDACIAKVSSCVLHLSTDQLCDCSTFQRKTVNKNYSDSLQDAFEDVVTFFGESSKTMPPSVFFPVFVRFIKAYRVSRHVKFHLLIRLSVCKAPPIQGPSESEQLAVRRRIICTECFVEIRWQKRRTNRGGVRSRCYLRKWSRRSSRKKTPRWDSHLWVFPGQYCSFSLKKLRDTCESRWTPSFLITGLIRMMKPPDSSWWFLKLFNENKNHWLESS